jgi:hypothetical protein
MASRSQAEAALARMGFRLDPAVSGKFGDLGYSATIDAIGRNTVDGECRGQSVNDYTAPAREFWQIVIDEARSLPTPTPCPHPEGECEFHDTQEDE